jgi:D-glycero-alpha-D-manno-heptose-7-phosphate kinase
MNQLDFRRDGTVAVSPIEVRPGVREELERHLVLFSDGSRRNSAGPLGELLRRIAADKQTSLALSELRETAMLVRSAIEREDIRTVGALVDRGWRAKRRLHSQVSTPQIDRCISMGRDVGALGGKLTGAGLTGALLFVCPPQHRDDLRHVMASQGRRELPLEIDDAGATIVEPREATATTGAF